MRKDKKGGLHRKIAASVLLNMFINRYENATPMTPFSAFAELKCKQHTDHDPRGPEHITTQWFS